MSSEQPKPLPRLYRKDRGRRGAKAADLARATLYRLPPHEDDPKRVTDGTLRMMRNREHRAKFPPHHELVAGLKLHPMAFLDADTRPLMRTLIRNVRNARRALEVVPNTKAGRTHLPSLERRLKKANKELRKARGPAKATEKKP